MRVLCIQILLCGIMLLGSCLRQQRLEPSYPKDVSGWVGHKEADGSIGRKFVLRKNEATDNGKVQIKVIDIIPGSPYAGVGSFQGQARARIQLIRMSDGKILCEDIYAEHGGSIFTPEGCGSTQSYITYLETIGISGIVIIAINLKEEWVYLQMNG